MARVPRPPADTQRMAPTAGHDRVRAASQRGSAAPVAGTTTSTTAQARPPSRYDHPDQAHPRLPGPDQRVPQSSLTSTETRAQSQCASCGTAQVPFPLLLSGEPLRLHLRLLTGSLDLLLLSEPGPSCAFFFPALLGSLLLELGRNLALFCRTPCGGALPPSGAATLPSGGFHISGR